MLKVILNLCEGQVKLVILFMLLVYPWLKARGKEPLKKNIKPQRREVRSPYTEVKSLRV